MNEAKYTIQSIKVGMIIEYTSYCGESRRVLVTDTDAETGMFEAVFVDQTVEEGGVWGYDYQITKIIKK